MGAEQQQTQGPPQAGLIHQLMPRVMSDIGVIGKERRNKAQSYDFRGVEDALNFVQPVLIKHGISLSTEVSDFKTDAIQENKAGGQGTRTIYRTTLLMDLKFFAPDGSSRSFRSAGEGLDYGGDKSTNKAMAAAFKYALFLGLCIPVASAQIDDSDRNDKAKTDANKPGTTNPIPAVHRPLDVGPQPGVPPAGQEWKGTDPCHGDQQTQIRELAVKLWGSKEAAGENLKKNLGKQNKSKLADLTYDQAASLIHAITKKITDSDPQQNFSGGGSTGQPS